LALDDAPNPPFDWLPVDEVSAAAAPVPALEAPNVNGFAAESLDVVRADPVAAVVAEAAAVAAVVVESAESFFSSLFPPPDAPQLVDPNDEDPNDVDPQLEVALSFFSVVVAVVAAVVESVLPHEIPPVVESVVGLEVELFAAVNGFATDAVALEFSSFLLSAVDPEDDPHEKAVAAALEVVAAG
jgi:hypothetical protein